MIVIDEQDGMDEEVYDPYFIIHCSCRNTLFVPILEKIKSNSSNDISRSCQACSKGCSKSDLSLCMLVQREYLVWR